jgi:hypothetical protein
LRGKEDIPSILPGLIVSDQDTLPLPQRKKPVFDALKKGCQMKIGETDSW